eukprot:2188445-Amphidinium_carterae.1
MATLHSSWKVVLYAWVSILKCPPGCSPAACAPFDVDIGMQRVCIQDVHVRVRRRRVPHDSRMRPFQSGSHLHHDAQVPRQFSNSHAKANPPTRNGEQFDGATEGCKGSLQESSRWCQVVLWSRQLLLITASAVLQAS